MTHNSDPDIEQLLQQYGADRRQQQTAADSVRYMARRQRRTAAGLVSIVIVALAAAWLFRSTPDTATTLSATMRTPSVPQAPAIKKTPNDNLQTTTYQPTDTQPLAYKPYSFPDITAALTPLHGTAQAESLALLPEPETMEKEKNDIPPCIVVPLSKGDGDAICSSAYTQTEEYEPTRQLENDSKLRVMAEVGAAMANAATPATPGNSRLQAGVGASLALADSKRYSLSLGVGISGNMRTDAPNMMHLKYDGNNMSGTNGIGMDNFSSDAEPAPEYYILHPGLNPLFNLYATLPLTFDLYPRGRSHTGLQFTLTPARNVAASSSKSLLNPWKLSIGLGIALPKNPVRSIGLSANLLPSFTDGPYKNIHEIGLVIGF